MPRTEYSPHPIPLPCGNLNNSPAVICFQRPDNRHVTVSMVVVVVGGGLHIDACIQAYTGNQLHVQSATDCEGKASEFKRIEQRNGS